MSAKKILLIGDSITDSGRQQDQEGIGFGYVRMIRDYYTVTYPTSNYQFINKGISGNRITDLVERWQKDVIDVQPDYLSISIGINDVWRQLDSPELEQVSPEKFHDYFEELLKQIKEKTFAQIILMEPTIIEEDIQSSGNQILRNYVEIVHNMAKEFNAIVVPTHQAFLQYLKSNHGLQLTTDGVHMTSAGDTLMAKTWIQAVEGKWGEF